MTVKPVVLFGIPDPAPRECSHSDTLRKTEQSLKVRLSPSQLAVTMGHDSLCLSAGTCLPSEHRA